MHLLWLHQQPHWVFNLLASVHTLTLVRIPQLLLVKMQKLVVKYQLVLIKVLVPQQ